MSIGQIRLTPIPPPQVVKLPDGRLRVTRRFRVDSEIARTPSELAAIVWEPWGTIDGSTAPADTFANQGGSAMSQVFSGCRLIQQSVQPSDRDGLAVCIKVYEELDATNETQVGGPQIVQLEDGREATVLTFIQFASAPYSPQVPGTSAAPPPYSGVLEQEQANNDGTLRTITRRYVTTGLIATSQRTGDDNLITRGYTFVGSVGTIIGTEVARSTRNVGGLQVIDVQTVSTVNDEPIIGNGGTPKLAYEMGKLVPFTWPGIAELRTGPGALNTFYLHLKPPVEALVNAKVQVYYQTEKDILPSDFTLDNAIGLWNPSSWATKYAAIASNWSQTVSIQGSTITNSAYTEAPGYVDVQALRGYRTANVLEVTGLEIPYPMGGAVTLYIKDVSFQNPRISGTGTLAEWVHDYTYDRVVSYSATDQWQYWADIFGKIHVRLRDNGTNYVIERRVIITDPLSFLISDTGYVIEQKTATTRGRTNKNAPNAYVNKSSNSGWVLVSTGPLSSSNSIFGTWTNGIALTLKEQRQTVRVGGLTYYLPTTSANPNVTENYQLVRGGYIDGRLVPSNSYGIMELSGGPPDPSGRRYVLDVDIRLANIGGSTPIYRKQVVIATITPT